VIPTGTGFEEVGAAAKGTEGTTGAETVGGATGATVGEALAEAELELILIFPCERRKKTETSFFC
jgi:hypothetical protein